jgi:hypothetical protein
MGSKVGGEIVAEPYRLKLKIGQHEFEAEGDPQVVHEQFQAFRELIANMGNQSSAPPPTSLAPEAQPILPSPEPGPSIVQIQLDKIMREDGRVVSLTIRPPNPDVAVLLLLYGQKMLRTNDSVSGAEIINGLSATGGISVSRVDKLIEKLGRQGDVIIFGEHRAKRYRLTNAGLSKARQYASDFCATVA